MFVVPLILCVMTFIGLRDLYSVKIQQEYDISQIRKGFILNPYAELKSINTHTFSSIIKGIRKSPDQIMNNNFLENENNKLIAKNAYLVLKKGNEVVFNGQKNSDEEVISKISQYNYRFSDKPPEFFMLSGDIVGKIFPMYLSNGTQVELFLVIDIARLFNLYKEFLTTMIVAAVFIIIAMGGFLTFFVSRSILTPLRELKMGTEKITNGDLDFKVEASSTDEIGNLCEAFDEMREKLKESVELQAQYENNRKELISNISHDLKTPITSIKGYVEGIRDGVADNKEKMDKYIQTIYNKAQSMDYLIDELLTYSKLDLNKLPFEFRKVDISSYMDDLMEEFKFDVEKNKIKFSYSNKIEEKANAYIDIQKISRVMTNIISNSIKYMDKEEGRIEVEMKLSGEEVIIRVQDNGKGISKEALLYIFDRFYREDSSRSSLTGGSGLGLAICKKIIEEHGGRIWAESEQGVGTNIWFSIKLDNNQEGLYYEK